MFYVYYYNMPFIGIVVHDSFNLNCLCLHCTGDTQLSVFE